MELIKQQSMSQNQLQVLPPNQSEHQYSPHQNNRNIVQQVINNEMFKLFLKDMVEELFFQKCQQERQQKEEDFQVSEDCVIQQISNSILIVAQNQANKKIKQAQKFFKQLYEHKVKQMEHRFQTIIQEKLKYIQTKMEQISSKSKLQSKSRMQTSILSPVKPIIKQNQLAELSMSQHLTKRFQLKQKILNTQHSSEFRHSMNVESNSLLSQSLNDVTIEKLNEKIRSIEQNFKLQIQQINNKIANVLTNTKVQIQFSQSNMKQHIDGGFEGIWNVISNLQKRMMS